jgi:hypothetical protein
VYGQAVATDRQANLLGLVVSDGIELLFGAR